MGPYQSTALAPALRNLCCYLKLLEKRGRKGENEEEERENRKSVENGVPV
jgi:hypothetical protein